MTAGDRVPLLRRALRSITVRLAVCAILLLLVPVIVYQQFRASDTERNDLLLESIRQQGVIIARALAPILRDLEPSRYPSLDQELAGFAHDGITLKLLFQPRDAPSGTFFFVAAVPPDRRENLERERHALVESGQLGAVWRSCSGEETVARRMIGRDGREELIISVSPVRTADGCWALVTGTSAAAVLATSIGRRYWQAPEVLFALGTYLAMTTIILVLVFDLGRHLRRFKRLAATIAQGRGGGQRFQDLNGVPELDDVAAGFDAMIRRLQDTAAAIREAAEENAHALKTPIGTISQSLEPLRRSVPADGERAARALEIIEQSCRRLAALVSSASEAIEAAAMIADPPRERIDLSALVTTLCSGFAGPCEARGVRLDMRIEPDVHVLGEEEMIETILENLVDNALGFSPAQSTVRVGLEAEGATAVLTVTDQGPGVPADRLSRIFEKGYSDRPPAPGSREPDTANFGLGLWLVRRQAEALGGTVEASNLPSRGLRMAVTLPRAA